jgi:hypothetical protein
MTLRRRILAALSVMFMALPYASGKYPPTPIEVVRVYCEFDLKTGRISTANFAKLPPLVTWETEPGWDTVTVVSGFKILSTKQSQDRAVVSVKWDVLGRAEGENITKDPKSELINFQLRLVNGLWKIEAPIIPPHVSVPTLQAFVLSHFQHQPERQALWIGNLGALEQSTRTKSTSLRPGVFEALAEDEKGYCDQFLGDYKKGCNQAFRANLLWLELEIAPSEQAAILVENHNMGACGSAGCSLYLFVQQPDAKFVQVLGTNGETGALADIIVLKDITKGHYDIQKAWRDGRTRTLYLWDGVRYSAR